MRKRLMELNPHSFRRIVGTLLEVNGRGYWETSDENIEQLKELSGAVARGQMTEVMDLIQQQVPEYKPIVLQTLQGSKVV